MRPTPLLVEADEDNPGDVVFIRREWGLAPILVLYAPDIADTQPIRWRRGPWTRIVQHDGTKWRLRADWQDVAAEVLAARGHLAKHQKIEPGGR